MPKLTVSIVNFNAGEYLLKCLRSLEKVKKEAELEIVVVDNNSSDDSITKAKQNFPKLHYILNQQNLGFGKAHNLVLKDIKTEYVLVLNPDTEVKSGTLNTMLDYMAQHPDVGAATCEVVLGDGKVDLTAHRGFPTPQAAFLYFFLKDESLYHLSNMNLKSNHEVDAISGSFFLTKKSVLNEVGLFDEDYFMYAEDIDLCFRIKEAGFKVMYIPTVSIIHHKGVSSGLKRQTQQVTTANLETKKRSLDAFYKTMKIFYQKHLAKKYPFFINWLVYFAIDLKWYLAKKDLTV